MTPKEKAKELVEKYWGSQIAIFELNNKQYAKQCALISVEEVINNIFTGHQATKIANVFWKEVKQEIELL
jgi:hypothetical protein